MLSSHRDGTQLEEKKGRQHLITRCMRFAPQLCIYRKSQTVLKPEFNPYLEGYVNKKFGKYSLVAIFESLNRRKRGAFFIKKEYECFSRCLLIYKFFTC